MKVPAAEFKAKCLALIDRVHQTGEEIAITKRGRLVARLVAAIDADQKPWERLRHRARWAGSPVAPPPGDHERPPR